MTGNPVVAEERVLEEVRGADDAFGERLLEIRFPSQPERLRTVRAAVSEAAISCGCSDPCVRDVVIAVDEACQNVIVHAYEGDPTREIIISLHRRNQELVLDIVDFGPPVDAGKVKPRPLDDIRPGGLGTHFIKECMDETGFEPPPRGAGNLLRMVKRIF